MLKIIWKENIRGKSMLAQDVILYILNMAVLAVAWQIYICVKKIQSSSWLEMTQIQMQEMGDSFIKDKSKLIISVLMILCLVVLAAVIFVLCIVIKNSLVSNLLMDGVKEAMGYSHAHIFAWGAAGQLIRIICSILPAYVVSVFLWKLLCCTRTMKEITGYVKMQSVVAFGVIGKIVFVFTLIVMAVYAMQFWKINKLSVIDKIRQG